MSFFVWIWIDFKGKRPSFFPSHPPFSFFSMDTFRSFINVFSFKVLMCFMLVFGIWNWNRMCFIRWKKKGKVIPQSTEDTGKDQSRWKESLFCLVGKDKITTNLFYQCIVPLCPLINYSHNFFYKYRVFIFSLYLIFILFSYFFLFYHVTYYNNFSFHLTILYIFPCLVNDHYD